MRGQSGQLVVPDIMHTQGGKAFRGESHKRNVLFGHFDALDARMQLPNVAEDLEVLHEQDRWLGLTETVGEIHMKAVWISSQEIQRRGVFAVKAHHNPPFENDDAEITFTTVEIQNHIDGNVD